MSEKLYDVVIVGGGPAGIFAALELIEKKPNAKILLLEKGKDITKRACPIVSNNSKCMKCNPCSIVNGWGGAGAFSDGKLTLTTEYGGFLGDYLEKDKLMSLINYVDDIYVKFGATTEVHGEDKEKIREIERKAAAAQLKLVPAIIKHLGTDKSLEILNDMQKFLQERIEIKFRTKVNDIITEEKDGQKYVKGVTADDGNSYFGKYVLVAPGRDGSEWFKGVCDKLKLSTVSNPVDIGVRVEVPAVVMENITDVVYESKFIYYTESFDDSVRTFCMNPYGKVVLENNSGTTTVNGHSYADLKTENTNFALLVSKSFTEPFKSPIAYGKYIAQLANMLSGGAIVQRLGDLLDGRRSTPERIKKGLVRPTLEDATPGDLSLVFPYRFIQDLIEMLKALDKVTPGVFSKHTLLYGVEAKFYSSRVKVNSNMETEVTNLFAAGDGSGTTRGLAQASVAGVVSAREILERL